MTITHQDLLNMRRWGKNAALRPEEGSALLAGQYMAIATPDEQVILRGEFEEGVRNYSLGIGRYDDAMWSLKDWQAYFTS